MPGTMTTVITLLIFALCIANLLGLAVLFLRLRRVHKFLYEVKDQVVIARDHVVDRILKQSQALMQLHRLLPGNDMVLTVGGWAASADFLLVLARHTLDQKPKVIVECGSGTSTLILAQCVKQNGTGHVYSLEHDLEYAVKTRERLAQAGLDKLATVIDAPLENGWYKTNAVPSVEIDMLIIDGPPQLANGLTRYPAGPNLLTKLRGVAFLDDAARPPERECVARWKQEFKPKQVIEYDCEKGCVALSYQ